MPMKVREVIRMLESKGWVQVRHKGSHRHFKHRNSKYILSVAGTDGQDVSPGVLRDILRKAGEL